MTPSVHLRPQAPSDEEIVRSAHRAHRAEMLGSTFLPPAALERLLDQQHELQERHISSLDPAAERLTIVADRRPVGRVVLVRGSAWRVVDIVLLPEAQGRGVGGSVLRRLLAEAAAAGRDLELNVSLDNVRAEALYRRVGFMDAMHGSATHRRMVASSRPSRTGAGV